MFLEEHSPIYYNIYNNTTTKIKVKAYLYNKTMILSIN